MPLLKRPIEPTLVTRTSDGQIPAGIRNELEYTANSTRANLIRQLSSLSQHAEDMFRELFEEATSIFERTKNLSVKVDTLRESVQQYDPNQVVVKLADITKRKPYKTNYHTDQQICTQATMPLSLQMMYKLCAAPPRLDRFDEFRSDNKASIKTYTNPDYFVQLWVEGIQKNVAEDKKKHGDRKIKKRPSKKQQKRVLDGNITDRKDKYAALAYGKEFVPSPKHQANQHQQNLQQAPPSPQQQPVMNGHNNQLEQPDSPGRYQFQHPPAPPAPPAPAQQNLGSHRQYQEMIYDTYNVNQPVRDSHTHVPPPHMVQSNSASSNISRSSGVTSSPSLNRMTMPPPPPPVNTGSALPTPPSPPQDNLDIVPPPPVILSSDIPRPASPPPPPDFTPSIVPPPPMPMGSPPRPIHHPTSVPPPPPAPPSGGPPPPPPPPPPPSAAPLITNSAVSQQPNAQMLSNAAAGLKSTENIPKPAPVKDERSELLNQIRIGFQLRSAEERKKNESNTSTIDKKVIGGGFDVQSIMDKVQEMRRVMENSDDSDTDEYDSDDWADDS